jgi:Fe-S-cluster containining protein
MDYQKDLNQAELEAKSNKKWVEKLSRLKDRDVDTMFHDAHEKVFEQIDCLKCANCCKTTSPIFRDIDIKRLSKRLKVSTGKLIDDYLHLDDEGDYVLNTSPCAFLQEDNSCAVYDDRPLACREYPHTNRKKMKQILKLTLKNTEVCPAVARIFEDLKKSMG